MHNLFQFYKKLFVDKSRHGKLNWSSIVSDRDCDSSRSATIIICVHNALESTSTCLTSLVHSVSRPFNIILVDDGSDKPTRRFLRQFVQQTPNVDLICNETARGYTYAANQGLKASQADYSILLNSDTILTDGWLEKIIRCGESDSRIGIVGPLSNAASYQSIPELATDKGTWKNNKIPKGWSIQSIGKGIEANSQARYPRVPILNGFCLAIKRQVIERIGYLDEKTFSEGYGEENDYCFRASSAGFQLTVCDDVYIFHSKSRSFGSTRRNVLAKKNGAVLAAQYGKKFVKKKVKELLQHPELGDIRTKFREMVIHHTPDMSNPSQSTDFRILYLLPVKGFSGGAHSVVQEARGMRDMGGFVQIAIPLKYHQLYDKNYPDYPKELFYYYESDDALVKYAGNFAICIATIFVTVKILNQIVQEFPRVNPAYYIQDYEPWFEPETSPLHQEALHSYNLIPHIFAFAKTDWIRETVIAHHGLTVHKVEPSVDHAIYYPNFFSIRYQKPITICAMVRPSTPRRNAAITMAILKYVSQKYGDRIRVEIFGVNDNDSNLKKLDLDFTFINHELCTQREVAELLRKSDIFVDFSTYQAFGRTGLEAMACGCAVILPKKGGVSEYARHNENCLLVDTSNEELIKNALCTLIENGEIRHRLRENGISIAGEYSVHKASLSILRLFQTCLRNRQDELSAIQYLPTLKTYKNSKSIQNSIRSSGRSVVEFR